MTIDSSVRICPGCGVKVVGHETCGDPTRPGCVTRSVEIPEAALDAVEDEVDSWPDDASLPWLPNVGKRAALRRLLAAALPYLPPAEASRQRVEQVLRERMLNSNFTAVRHEPLRTQTVDQWADVLAGALFHAGLFAAPAGDGGLREALEKLVQEWCYTAEDLKPWQEGGGPDPYESAMDQCAAELKRVLDVPAAPAPVVGVCEHPSDIFGPCTLLQGHELHGYLHQNTKGEKWSNFGEPAHTAQPAVPQPAVALGDVLQVLDDVYSSGAMGGEWPSLGADAVMELLREAAVPQPVDREALIKWVGKTLTFEHFRDWSDEDFADAVLAMLAGEQEQVEK